MTERPCPSEKDFEDFPLNRDDRFTVRRREHLLQAKVDLILARLRAHESGVLDWREKGGENA